MGPRMDLSCSGFFLLGWVLSETKPNTHHNPKGLLSPRKKQCRGCQVGWEQDRPLRSQYSWCQGRGVRVTVGTCALEGSGALVYVRAGAGRCQGCEPDPRSWLSHRLWLGQGQGVGVRD